MGQGQNGTHGVPQDAKPDVSVDWDWDTMERRGRIATRIGGYAFGATAASLAGLVMILILGSSYTVMVVVACSAVVSFAVLLVASLASQFGFLLDPRTYWDWLRALGPYEPETVLEQARDQLATWIGGTWLFVLGALLGAMFGADPAQASIVTTQYVGYLLLGGIPFLWWSAFLARLASLHRRAIKRNELPGECDRVALFGLFLTYWVVGAGMVLSVVLGGPELVKAMVAAGSAP